MPDRASVHGGLERVLRDERARLTGALVRLLGDWDVAEELVQDALVAALEHWPISGVPDNPAAWLMTAARRKAVDRLRRDARYRDRMRMLTAEATDGAGRIGTGGPMATDDRLRLLFTCCHPALGREAQVALTLRTVGGLETPAIARAFLVPDATIAQRLVRAKRKIREARIPYRVPDDAELPARLGEVLSVLYLIFNEGYLSSSGASAERRDLARDAEWLTSLVSRLMPDEPEVLGLLALMRLHLARAEARFAGEALVLLRDQDRALWDRGAIEAALAVLAAAERMGRPGPYQLQAAIVGAHASARTWSDTDWGAIVRLYDALHVLQPTPVVALNRALAVAERDGAAAGIAALEPVAGRLEDYHLYHAARGELLRRLGDADAARAADRRALELTENPAERRVLTERIAT